MPRASEPSNSAQLVKALIIGDGKCGKTHWAAEAAGAGFNVLYFDGDVAAQTINKLPMALRERIFILNVRDKIGAGGLDHSMVDFYKEFTTCRGSFLWNDTQSRLFSRMQDGDSTTDEIWEIRPGNLDENWVVVDDSWTALVQSTMQWAAEELGITLSEISESDRKQMRTLYQIAGEKLTIHLAMIRSSPFHRITISHPNEFVKTEKPTNVTISKAKEGDLKILWTKMVPKSVTNNHAMTMAKFFTDIAWLEVDAMGRFKIDYRASGERISGGHRTDYVESAGDGSFAKLVESVGGIVPGNSPSDWSSVITIHKGYEVAAPAAKPKIVLGATPAPAQVSGAGVKPALNLSLATKRNPT